MKSEPQLDIVLPVNGGVEAIEVLLKKVNSLLSKASIRYNLIIVSNGISDDLSRKIHRVAKRYTSGNIVYDRSNKGIENTEISSVELLSNCVKQRKTQLVFQALKKTSSPHIAIIDVDFNCRLENIPKMYKMVKNHGAVVAKQMYAKKSFKQRVLFRLNFVKKWLFGFDYSYIPGIIFFKRKVVEGLKCPNTNLQTLYFGILSRALDLGYEIGKVDIEAGEKTNNYKKDGLIDLLLFVASAIQLRLKSDTVFEIKSQNGSLVGAGVVHKGKKFVTHTSLGSQVSALQTFYPWQKYGLIFIACLSIIFFVTDPLGTVVFLVSILTVLYLLDLIFGLILFKRSLEHSFEITIKTDEVKKLSINNLPIYTILCPLYKESDVLPQFIRNIKNLNWPKDKLDVILLLEEDDKETIEMANSLGLPSYIRTLIVPHSYPKTKPKACNYGLAYAKGEYLVVYDAEDRPDPFQLKKAYLAFEKSSPMVVCIQSKLNYYNTDQNILTRLFTAEYSLWFDLILPGLQSINTTIPLGGTSNHFKTYALRYLDAWDPFNVTEDCDLGTRLFRKGCQTAIINSTTYEEANSRVKSWIKQRSRWIKGYMQTYLVHMRNPFSFYKENGIHAFIFQLVIGLRMVFILVNPILWTTTLAYFLFRPQLGPIIESFYPGTIYYLAVFTMVFGNFIYFYIYMIGLAKRKQWSTIKYVFFIPFYWLLTSIASFVAFYQLLVKPHHWEKTQHGFHLGGWLGRNRREIRFRIALEFNLPKFVPQLAARLLGLIQKLIFIIGKNILDFDGIITDIPLNERKINGKLRILIFNWRDIKHTWAGGAEVYVHQIAKRWVKDGHKVTVFSGWDGVTKRYEQIDGVDVVRRGGFYTVYLFAVLYYLFKLRKYYDVVIDCENGIPFFTPLYVNVPKILIIHHVHQRYLRSHAPFPFSYIASFAEATLMPVFYRSSKIVTISESSKRDILAMDWGRNNNINIVNPGVDFSIYKKFKKTKYPSFIYVGRLKPYKNVDIAIRAFAKVCQKTKDARMTIVGTGESEDKLRKLVDKLGLGNLVTFTGFVDEEVKIELLGQSWVAIQPSSFEGWGITVIESNAVGTCVIASDIGGLTDSVVDNVTGILVPQRNVAVLALAMNKLIGNANLRLSMSENAYQWSKTFSWDKSAEKFLNVVYGQVTREQHLLPVKTFALAKEAK